MPQKQADGEPLNQDLLHGADAIAEFVFGSPSDRRKVYYLSSEAKGKNRLPLFKLGGILCGRRSTLLQWIAEQEKAA